MSNDKVDLDQSHKIKIKKIKEIKKFGSELASMLAVMLNFANQSDFDNAKKVEKAIDDKIDSVKTDANLLKAILGKEVEVFKFISTININMLPKSSRDNVNAIYADAVVSIANVYESITIDALPNGYTEFLKEYYVSLEQALKNTGDEMVCENTEQLDNNNEGCQMNVNGNNIVADGEEFKVDTNINPEQLANEIKDAENDLENTESNEIKNDIDVENEDKSKPTLEEKCESLGVPKPVQANVPSDNEKDAVKTFNDQAKDAIKKRLEDINKKKDEVKPTSIVMDYVVPAAGALLVGAAVGYAAVKIYEAVTSKDNGNGWI